jgi:hypothetical protein
MLDKLANSFHVREQPGAATRLRVLRADLLFDIGQKKDALDEFRGAALDALAADDQDLAGFATYRGAERLRESGDPAGAQAFWESLMAPPTDEQS